MTSMLIPKHKEIILYTKEDESVVPAFCYSEFKGICPTTHNIVHHHREQQIYKYCFYVVDANTHEILFKLPFTGTVFTL